MRPRLEPAVAAPAAAAGGGGFGGGGFGGARLPMTVELASVKRADMAERVTVVGNLIGEATVETVPKVAGRLESVSVRLGDSVRRGQTLAKIEDRELLEQINQARASFEVSAATIRQREADLRFAQTNLDRSKNLFDRAADSAADLRRCRGAVSRHRRRSSIWQKRSTSRRRRGWTS